MESMHTDVWVETGYNLQIPGTQQTYLSTSQAGMNEMHPSVEQNQGTNYAPRFTLHESTL